MQQPGESLAVCVYLHLSSHLLRFEDLGAISLANSVEACLLLLLEQLLHLDMLSPPRLLC